MKTTIKDLMRSLLLLPIFLAPSVAKSWTNYNDYMTCKAAYQNACSTQCNSTYPGSRGEASTSYSNQDILNCSCFASNDAYLGTGTQGNCASGTSPTAPPFGTPPTNVTAFSLIKFFENAINECGSVIQPENRVLTESIPVSGAPFALNYTSAMNANRKDAYTLVINLTGSSLPSGVTSYDVRVRDMATNVWDNVNLPVATDLSYRFTWNGGDIPAATAVGTKKFEVRVIVNTTGGPSTYTSYVVLGQPNAAILGLGNWVPSIWGYYDAESKREWLGDGTVRVVPNGPGGSAPYTVTDESKTVNRVYDSSGKITEIKAYKTGGTLFAFTYGTGNVLSSITEMGTKTTTFNRSRGLWTGITAPNTRFTRAHSNAFGYLDELELSTIGTYYMTYASGNSLLATFTKPNSSVTTFGWDASGNLISESHSGGSSLTLTKTGRKIDLQSAMMRSWSVEDTTGANAGFASTKITRKDGSQYSILQSPFETKVQEGAYQATYNEKYNITPSLVGTRIAEQLLTPRVLIREPNTIPTTHQIETYRLEGTSTWVKDDYDPALKKQVLTTSGGRTIEVIYDSLMRPVSYTRGNLTPSTYQYHPSYQKLVRIEEGMNRFVAFNYDSYQDVSGFYGYSGYGPMIIRDAAGRTTTLLRPDMSTVAMTYDGAGNLTSVTPPSRPVHSFVIGGHELPTDYVAPSLGVGIPSTTTFAYNSDKQLTQINRPTGQSIVYGYNTVTGNLDTVTTPAGVTNITYTSGLPFPSSLSGPNGFSLESKSTAKVLKGFDFKVSGILRASYEMFSASGSHGRVTSDVVSDALGTNLSVSYGYDSDELLTSAGSQTMAYHSTNGILTSKFMSGISQLFSHSTFGEDLGSQATHTTLGTNYFSETLVRDHEGRVTKKTVSLLGSLGVVYDYTYNPMGFLATVKRNGTTVATYTYGTNGNRTGGVIGGVTTSATYNAQDSMTQYNVNTYTYNDNGDLTSKTNTVTSVTHTYVYDVEGNLVQATVPGKVIDYEIDPLNRRVGRIVNGVLQRRFVYDTEDRIVGELNASNQLIRRYVYGTKPHTPDFYVESGVNYQIISDYLGSPRAIVNASTGSTIASMDHDEFGRVLVNTSPGLIPFGFAGGIYDADTGLVRFGARDYDSETGRWTSKDPILFNGGDANLYGYVFQDPVNFTDPSGQCPWCITAAVGALVSGGIDLGVQLANNGGSLTDVKWGSVFISAGAGAVVSTLSPTGLLLGRGGARAIEQGYSKSAGILNYGHVRFGWGFRESTKSSVLRFAIGNTFKQDLAWLGTASGKARPIWNGVMSGVLGSSSGRAICQ